MTHNNVFINLVLQNALAHSTIRYAADSAKSERIYLFMTHHLHYKIKQQLISYMLWLRINMINPNFIYLIMRQTATLCTLTVEHASLCQNEPLIGIQTVWRTLM